MIEHDSYWRKDLIKFGERLEKRYRQRKWSERTLYNIEKEVFLSFYIIRKLIERESMEGGVVDSQIIHAQHIITMYPIVTGVTLSRDPKMFAHNYLFREQSVKLNLKKLCDQFIHSYIFSPFAPVRRDMLGIFFASDRQSKTGLYYITLIKVIEIIISAGRNRPIKLKLGRKSGAFKVNLGKLVVT